MVFNFCHLGLTKNFAGINFSNLGFNYDLPRINFLDLGLQKNISTTFFVIFKMVSVKMILLLLKRITEVIDGLEEM